MKYDLIITVSCTYTCQSDNKVLDLIQQTKLEKICKFGLSESKVIQDNF